MDPSFQPPESLAGSIVIMCPESLNVHYPFEQLGEQHRPLCFHINK